MVKRQSSSQLDFNLVSLFIKPFFFPWRLVVKVNSKGRFGIKSDKERSSLPLDEA